MAPYYIPCEVKLLRCHCLSLWCFCTSSVMCFCLFLRLDLVLLKTPVIASLWPKLLFYLNDVASYVLSCWM